MKLSEFIRRLKLTKPSLGQPGAVNDEYLTDLINEGCDQANLLVKAYKGFTDFNVSANVKLYALSSVVPLYLGRDKRGLFFKDDAGEWQKVTVRTEAWLAEYNQNYLNSQSVDIPQWYCIDGDELILEPAPEADQASGARLYHLKTATKMTQSGHYPYSGSATEIKALKPMDEAIIAYVDWKLSPTYGKVTDVDLGERAFISACRRASRSIKRAPDLSQSSDNRMRL